MRGSVSGHAGFIERWVETLLYYDWPTWVFNVLYLTFAALVISTWIAIPPHRRNGDQ